MELMWRELIVIILAVAFVSAGIVAVGTQPVECFKPGEWCTTVCGYTDPYDPNYTPKTTNVMWQSPGFDIIYNISCNCPAEVS